MRDLTERELRDGLESALAVPRWVDEVVASAPFSSSDELISAANRAAENLTTAEIDQAMAHHPRIGEKPVGEGASQAFSRAEQAAPDADDADLAAALAEGNRAYEARFDRVFLIRAAGRSRAEILAELRRRVQLDDATERGIVADQLREIAILRLRSTFDSAVADPATSTTAANPEGMDHEPDQHARSRHREGVPAVGVPVALQGLFSGTWTPLAITVTDAAGRAADLGDDDLAGGQYRLIFDTSSHFAASGQASFFPEIAVTFVVAAGGEHYHVPLLLNPFGYSTYRGT